MSKDFTNEELKHLEFIQNIITRMNTNSFQIKGMCITIVSALLAIYASTSNITFIFIAILPALLFWGLDSFYLQQERKFRGVYNTIIEVVKVDFQIKPFEMPIHKFKGGKYSFMNVFISITQIGLYLFLILLLFFGGCYLQKKNVASSIGHTAIQFDSKDNVLEIDIEKLIENQNTADKVIDIQITLDKLMKEQEILQLSVEEIMQLQSSINNSTTENAEE